MEGREVTSRDTKRDIQLSAVPTGFEYWFTA